ncbi:MAG: gamma-glutamylcyclotransferase [Aphanocapsa lilacina HA4352-LM1]|jgi:cation transport regulator ChaC|nr:gamma-glutamylcyclotransferase [Aphanocapsa lilacina HA4352-LM1]
MSLYDYDPGDDEPTFLYFAYGSCMCPVDLKRSLAEDVHGRVVGAARLSGYRLGFFHYLERRNCGALDIVPDPHGEVEGVLYRLPWRLGGLLDAREGVGQGDYRHAFVEVSCRGRVYRGVRTYTVVDKLSEEMAPNEWYGSVVLRGAFTCGLSESYCWRLFERMCWLEARRQPADAKCPPHRRRQGGRIAV